MFKDVITFNMTFIPIINLSKHHADHLAALPPSSGPEEMIQSTKSSVIKSHSWRQTESSAVVCHLVALTGTLDNKKTAATKLWLMADFYLFIIVRFRYFSNWTQQVMLKSSGCCSSWCSELPVVIKWLCIVMTLSVAHKLIIISFLLHFFSSSSGLTTKGVPSDQRHDFHPLVAELCLAWVWRWAQCASSGSVLLSRCACASVFSLSFSSICTTIW